MPEVVRHLISQFQAWVGGRVRLDHKRRPFVEVGYLPHCMESIIALSDEVLHCLWVEAEEYELLNDSVNQFLELRRVSQ